MPTTDPRPSLRGLAAPIALALAVVAPLWLEGRLLLPGPGFAHDFGLRELVARAYAEPAMPWWNANEAVGRPLAADPHAGAFFPGNLPFWWLPPTAASDLAGLLALAAAAAGAWCLARERGAGMAAALAAAALYPYAWLLLPGAHLSGLQLAALLPWLLLAARRAVGPALAVGVALAFLVGPPLAALVAVAGAVVYARPWAAPRGELARALGLGVALATPQWLPTLDYLATTAWPHGHLLSDALELGAAGALLAVALALAALAGRHPALARGLATGLVALDLAGGSLWLRPRCPLPPDPPAPRHQLFDGLGRALGWPADPAAVPPDLGAALRRMPAAALSGTRELTGVLDPISPRLATLLDATPGCHQLPGPGVFAPENHAFDVLALRWILLEPSLADQPLWRARLAPDRWRPALRNASVAIFGRRQRVRRLARVTRATVLAPAEVDRRLTHDPTFSATDEALLEAPLPGGPWTRGGTNGRLTSPDEVRVLTRGAGPGLLVLNEGYDPGWQAAREDGPRRVPVPLVRADAVGMAFTVPPGRQVVWLRYEPRTARVAWAIAAVALALLLAWWRPAAAPASAEGSS